MLHKDVYVNSFFLKGFPYESSSHHMVYKILYVVFIIITIYDYCLVNIVILYYS